MPRYNFLDEAGLKKYHQLAGYSTIPITAVTNYTYGKLNTTNGSADYSDHSYKVTDYIELRNDRKYTILYPLPAVKNIICYYDNNNNFLSGRTFTTKITFALSDGTSGGVTPTKIRVSCGAQAPCNIQALHQNTISWLCNDILENRSDIATNRNDITTNRNDIIETNNTIVRLHATYNIGVTPITIEKGVSNKITISDTYFRFDGNKIYPSGGYEITRSGAAGNLKLFDGGGDGELLNTGGSINDTISKSATYTLSMTHLGGTFTKAVSVSAYYPIIYGSTPDPRISEEYLERIWGDIGTDFYKSVKSNPSGTYTFTTQKDDYMYILVPRDEESDGRYNMTISDVKSGGFEVPMISQGLVEMNSHTNRKYNVYRSQIQVNAGQKTLVVTGSCATI